ncbi:MAG: O-antigen ligase family protein [Butyrivibrio sp.]
MKIRFDRIFLLKFLIVVLTINYMVITIIFKDMILLKYLRDIVLILTILICLSNKEFMFTRKSLVFVVILMFFVIAMFRADSLSMGVACLRRYIFPLGVLFAVTRMESLKKEVNYKSFLKFILIFFAIISIWGVFQAWVLGDEFLMKLGYPTMYLNQYKRVMLKYSFYFGGLGIQRVVSTISNSNICGLILGSSLLFLISCYPYIPVSRKFKNIFLIAIGVGYLLTFSRSNLLALVFVALFIAFKYIPYKKQMILVLMGVISAGVILFAVQGSDGLVYKLLEWIKSSLNLTDTSVAGRSDIWSEALQTIIQNPLGLGFGHVGSIAIEAGAKYYVSCENSYLAMAIDFGIAGALLYIGFMVYLINDFRKKAKIYKKNGDIFRYRISKGGQSVIIYLMIVMFFSNHIYDMEAVAIIYAYVGIAFILTRHTGRLYETQSDSGCINNNGGQDENNSILFAAISLNTGK